MITSNRLVQRFSGPVVAFMLLAPGMAAALPATAQQGPAMPVTASAAPADTAIFMSVDLDGESAQARMAQALLDRLGIGPSEEEWREMIAGSMGSNGDISPQDLEALLGGEAALAISPAMIERVVAAVEASGLDSATPISDLDSKAADAAFRDAFDDGLGIVAILEPSDPDRAWEYVERQMTEAASDAAGTVNTETYNGVEVLSAPDASFYGKDEAWSDKDDASGSGEIVTARVGDLILTATSAIDLRPAIDAASGGESLAGDETMLEARAALPPDALAFMFVNARPLTDALGSRWTDLLVTQVEGTLDEREARSLFDVVSATALSADDPGFRIDNVHLRPDGQPIPAIYPGPMSGEFADRIPAGTVLYSEGTLPRFSLDQMAYSIALSVLSENDAYVTPQTLEETISLYTPAVLAKRVDEAERFIGFNLKRDFFDDLDGTFGIGVGLPSIGIAGVGVDAIWTMGASDPAAVAASLVKVARLAERSGDVDVAATRIDGDTFYGVKPAGDAEGVPGFGFGVLGGDLVAGTESGIAAWREGTDTPLSGDSQFQQVMDLLPQEPWMAAYMDFREIVPLAMQLTEIGDIEAPSSDADPSCAGYAGQTEAQAAFEQEPLANSPLDSDFDGMACEDYFPSGAATPQAGAGSPENLRAFGMTGWERDGRMGWSMILHIAEPGS